MGKQLTISVPTPKRSIGEAADGPQLCPPHDWRCPVTMKLDPNHVAWTCARCGAIATTDVSAMRPEEASLDD
jgi:hypothetical protein